MDQIKILLADDEAGIRDMLKAYMSLENYTVMEAKDGLEAMTLGKNETFDLILLDVMMPKFEGWTVCREIRKISQVPIIMITARGEEYDKLLGFELGVDDYVVKPFSPRELMARIKALLARAALKQKKEEVTEVLVYQGLVIDLLGRTVTIDGKRVNLTPKEYDLIRFLGENPRKAMSREHLLMEVWGYDFQGDNRTVDTHIKQLREQLTTYRHFIGTVWGVGYKFDPEAKE